MGVSLTYMFEVGALVVNDAIAATTALACALGTINAIVALGRSQLSVLQIDGSLKTTSSRSYHIPNSS